MLSEFVSMFKDYDFNSKNYFSDVRLSEGMIDDVLNRMTGPLINQDGMLLENALDAMTLNTESDLQALSTLSYCLNQYWSRYIEDLIKILRPGLICKDPVLDKYRQRWSNFQLALELIMVMLDGRFEVPDVDSFLTLVETPILDTCKALYPALFAQAVEYDSTVSQRVLREVLLRKLSFELKKPSIVQLLKKPTDIKESFYSETEREEPIFWEFTRRTSSRLNDGYQPLNNRYITDRSFRTQFSCRIGIPEPMFLSDARIRRLTWQLYKRDFVGPNDLEAHSIQQMHSQLIDKQSNDNPLNNRIDKVLIDIFSTMMLLENFHKLFHHTRPRHSWSSLPPYSTWTVDRYERFNMSVLIHDLVLNIF